MNQQNKETAQRTLEYAIANGCQAARISLHNNSNTTFEIRNMQIDSLQQATEYGLSAQLFVDGRYGSISTNRLDWSELQRFIRNGIDSIRYLAQD
ncbi:MAG: TldD/PmbA family protein, partial [Tannerella sp.]|nr:TldD/PmbA family protein [Tannerella sp.]